MNPGRSTGPALVAGGWALQQLWLFWVAPIFGAIAGGGASVGLVLGGALTQPPLVALSIFAALGAGLSLPYLLLCFAPWLRRALPKPGAWMDTLKQLFAFPMYASAAWLLWVLAQQTAAIGLAAALAGAVLIGLAAWAYQRSKTSRARPSRWCGRMRSI